MKIVRLNEPDALLISRAFLPHNPNKLRGALDRRDELRDACHRFRAALGAAAEPNSDASFLLATLQQCRAILELLPDSPARHPLNVAEALGAVRIAILGLESGEGA